MVAAAIVAAGCGAQQEPEQHEFPDANDPEYAASFDGETDSRISTSVGEEGGVVVLWPRVVPADDAGSLSSVAASLQERLRTIAEKALPGRPQDVRPEPERACPYRGCKGVSIGAVLAHAGQGCAVVAIVSRPGQSAANLVAWTSGTKVRASVVPFREPPESKIEVSDYRPCQELESDLAERDPAVEAAAREAGASMNDPVE